jgi:hypothetical protein
MPQFHSSAEDRPFKGARSFPPTPAGAIGQDIVPPGPAGQPSAFRRVGRVRQPLYAFGNYFAELHYLLA